MVNSKRTRSPFTIYNPPFTIYNSKLNKSHINLKIILRGEYLPKASLAMAIDECDQLCRIINASIQTTLRGMKR